MAVLVLNAGSSSLKFALYEPARSTSYSPIHFEVIFAGAVKGIGHHVTMDLRGHAIASERSAAIQTHEDAVRWVVEQVKDRPIESVGHRVVHGGRWFTHTAVIDNVVLARLEELARLAPLHYAGSLAGIRTVRSLLGDQVPPMAAVFDTTFHLTIPDYVATYAIPRDFSARHAIRRYGFHGLAHASSAARYATLRGSSPDQVNLITVHLGNGCSATAIRGGRSVDTSMGFTPLEGLVMGTRCGDLDPAIVSFLAEQEDLPAKEIEQILNTRSGLLGLSGLSSDMAELMRAERAGHSGARLAIDVFCYRVRKYIGAYLAVLGRVDAVLFSGGIGEHAPDIRARICNGMDWCGMDLVPDANAGVNGLEPGEIVCVSKDGAALPVYVTGVDEEGEIARETVACFSPTTGQ
jgi:acetate kinase